MTSWEQEILATLTNHVRAFSLPQLATTWWTGQRRRMRQARRSIRRLSSFGWVEIHRVLARPIVVLEQPLAEWQPDSARPQFSDLAKHLHARAMVSARVTTVITATRRSHELFGKGGAAGRLKLTQLTHDLQVAEVFLTYRRQGIDVSRWVAEDALSAVLSIRQRPDAALLDERSENLSRAIEYGGDYTVKRLELFHDAVASICLPYEIW